MYPASAVRNLLFSTVVTFTSGATTGSIVYATLDISSTVTVPGTDFVVILKPVLKDADVIRITNGEASIKILIQSTN